ncbi:hypothetical protein WR25_20762 [Diploscapter pachys]|uniref:Uncharacterized protein n=1 Tax=Diploscapter pachys TaxID=2018661 RepID=A0A2A2KDH0_9BILA|nr:hypothetical protein WR25_20762 [Diploscapter pachys]
MPRFKRRFNSDHPNPVLRQIRRIEHASGAAAASASANASDANSDVQEVDVDEEGQEQNGIDDRMVISEISPIERRIREGRSFNDGNWKSTELKSLFELLKAYGTRADAVAKYGDVYLSRSTEEIFSKIDEIRQLNAEHREDRISYERSEWKAIGAEEINTDDDPHFKYSKYEKVKTFVDAGHEITRRFYPHYKLKMFQETINESLSQLFIPPPLKAVTFETSSGETKQACLSWENIHKFILGVNTVKSQATHLTPLDASVILRMLDEIEEEALETTKDEERAIFKGMLWNVKSGFFKDFEPDLPCSLFTASQVPLDPFRTRLWDIPPGGCPVPPNVGVTIKRKRKSATSTITLLSSNATNKAKRSCARAENASQMGQPCSSQSQPIERQRNLEELLQEAEEQQNEGGGADVDVLGHRPVQQQQQQQQQQMPLPGQGAGPGTLQQMMQMHMGGHIPVCSTMSTMNAPMPMPPPLHPSHASHSMPPMSMSMPMPHPTHPLTLHSHPLQHSHAHAHSHVNPNDIPDYDLEQL